MIINLADNAIKYTPKGSGTVIETKITNKSVDNSDYYMACKLKDISLKQSNLPDITEQVGLAVFPLSGVTLQFEFMLGLFVGSLIMLEKIQNKRLCHNSGQGRFGNDYICSNWHLTKFDKCGTMAVRSATRNDSSALKNFCVRCRKRRQ